ncbi:ribosome small subunit-dependent GTPase A [Embleya scabrispora]|uniref:ribosome small subunit-dependent GTPase A n=1 Tax=Embleya scabrispora TaxID=159449 RepID=UPI00037A322C|nr:ribosome small subunit-dependent GTPase A [Embleya scabrispora]
MSTSDVLAAYGWDADRDAEFAPYRTHGLVPGRIARVDRSLCEVVTADGSVRAAHGGGELPCTGDWAALEFPDDGREAFVAALLERRTALVRSQASGRSAGQVLAVNVDLIGAVVPLDVAPDLGRLERLLTLAWESGGTPLVVLTKADLAADADDLRADVEAVAMGVDVVVASALTGEGLDVLQAYTAGRTVALIGTSGAGKSTLTNALAGAEVTSVQQVRGDGKGRHTTTWRELVPLPGGGVLVDTPGMRGVGMYDVGEGLDRTFADIDALIADCRFVDCTHESEPGCAVLAAIDAGELPRRRLDSYRKLLREARWMASREDHRIRAERAREWKLIHKEMRRSPSPKK